MKVNWSKNILSEGLLLMNLNEIMFFGVAVYAVRMLILTRKRPKCQVVRTCEKHKLENKEVEYVFL